MFRRGEISSIDYTKNVASVVFRDLDETVSANLPIMYHTIRDATISGEYTLTINDPITAVSGPGSVSGNVNIDYIPYYKVNDLVVVIFFSNDLTDGAIVGKIGGG